MELLPNKLMLGMFLLVMLAWPAPFFIPAAFGHDSPEAAIMDDELRQAALFYEQQQKEAARLQREIQRRQRVSRELEALISKASAQHAQIRKWEKSHSKGLQTQTKTKQQKKRLQVAVTEPR